MSVEDRAHEIAEFLGMPEADALAKLRTGFLPLHEAVTQDFKLHGNGVVKTGDELLDWYRATESYIWELSAYHEDPGWNYQGMCDGIATHLKNAGVESVLCLGDGIGDLTLTLHRAALRPFYHDLFGSKTARYAAFRFNRQTGNNFSTNWWDRGAGHFGFHNGSYHEWPLTYDAVVSLDFLEHVPYVPDWVRDIHGALKPGGLFCAQNAFAIGSGENGAMPMHLAVNDRFEKDWDPLLAEVGFEQMSSNWYRKR